MIAVADEAPAWCAPCLRWGALRIEYTHENAVAAAQVSEGASIAFPCPFNPVVWHLHKKARHDPVPFSDSGP